MFAISLSDPEFSMKFLMKTRSSGSNSKSHVGMVLVIGVPPVNFSLFFNNVKVKFDFIKVLWCCGALMYNE